MPSPTELHCYRPRPITVELSPRDHAVWKVLDDATGMYSRGGLEPTMIAAQLKLRGVALPMREIRRALQSLRAKHLAERVAAPVERWRKA